MKDRVHVKQEGVIKIDRLGLDLLARREPRADVFGPQEHGSAHGRIHQGQDRGDGLKVLLHEGTGSGRNGNAGGRRRRPPASFVRYGGAYRLAPMWIPARIEMVFGLDLMSSEISCRVQL